MKRSILSILIFFGSVSLSLLFQNCGQSSMQSARSNNDDLTVDIVPELGQETNDFNFNLNNGDQVVYNSGSSASAEQSVARIYGQRFFTIKESTLFESKGTRFDPDLSASYCVNSALPHCIHRNTVVCMGTNCPPLPKPVRCHWQKRMSPNDVQTTFSALNNIAFMTRTVSENDPHILDCNTPILSFVSAEKTLTASLAERSCVPAGDYYVSAGADALVSLFNNEFAQVDERDQLCNRYSTYHWSTTSFDYLSQSSEAVNEMEQQERSISYENQRAKLRFKIPGNSQYYCSEILLTPDELSVFFPMQGGGGLDYSIIRPNSAPVDVDRHEISYHAPIDGGAKWQFFLNEQSALASGGGALLKSSQAAAMDNLVQVWVDRVLNSSASHDCQEP